MLVVLELLILVGGIVAVLGGATLALRVALRALLERADRRSPWKLEKRTVDAEHIGVYVERPGQQPQEIAVLDTGDDDFDSQLYLAESRARNTARALNG